MSGADFKDGNEVRDEERAAIAKRFRYHEDASPSSATLVVRPEVGLAEACAVWNDFLKLRDEILADPACFDILDGHREMNRTGATRLALPFGLSIQERDIEEGRVELADEGQFDYRFRVRVRVSKGARFVDNIGSCRLSEIPERTRDKGHPGTVDFKPGHAVPLSQREHFALSKAWTRAVKRAIADILGGVEAE
ncbi:MAG TPA: hypothetical protein VGU43_04615 [Thermoplasmata archaeon]|nr:hypothetical protein [Thermoplasmata archaeon]